MDNPMSAGAWTRLLAEVEGHRTVGYLAWAVAEGSVVATEDQQAEIADRHAKLMHQALVIESEGRDLVRRCGGRPILLKGVAAAHLDHRDPSLRVFQDVDALVPPGDVDDVVRSLEAVGMRRDLPPRTETWDRRFAKDITFVGDAGAEIDLHRTLVPGPFGFSIDVEELAAGTVDLDLGGVKARALDPERRVIASSLALTAGEASPRLAAGLDMAGTLERHDVDLDAVIQLAERWRVGSLLAEGVCWSVEQLGGQPFPAELARWARARPTESWERRWRRLYRSKGGSNTATLLGAPLGMRSWRDRRDYLRGLLAPDVAYRKARERSSRPREWRTGARELLRGRS